MKTVKELVKSNDPNVPRVAYFTHAIAGTLFYRIDTEDESYQFPVDMNDKEDVGSTTFVSEYKAIFLMRYINKAVAKGELIRVK